ncbi:MAG: response regulator [Bacteroidota bacterium]|nr:response regulator [Bacteroidota bacterium]MDP4214325.1 response regulator [Bacteroidota bacterium]MDP4252251.1 response regulator [Bacteroidota bacterium]
MYLQSSPGIFIVEDNLIYQQLIARELEGFGGHLYFYTSGESCLASLNHHPSMVVLDYSLDGEINGLETLEEIRKFDSSIFVILFSSQREVQSDENFKRYGSFDFLEKRDQSFSTLKQLVKARMSW